MVEKAIEKFKAFWLAVLKQALADINGPTQEEIDAFIFDIKEKSREWIESDSAAPGSFRWVCDMQGLEYTYIRKKALEGKPESEAKTIPRNG